MKIAFGPLLFSYGPATYRFGGEHVSRIICGNLGNNILTRAMRYADEMDNSARFSGYKSS